MFSKEDIRKIVKYEIVEDYVRKLKRLEETMEDLETKIKDNYGEYNKNKDLLRKRAEYSSQRNYVYGKIDILKECIKELGFDYDIIKSK